VFNPRPACGPVDGFVRPSLGFAVVKYCCDRKSRAACAQSFAPWQQATIEIMLAISLTIACSLYTYDGVILPAHPVRGESHNQRNTTGEVATVSYILTTCPHFDNPEFYNFVVGSPQCHIITSDTIAVRFRMLSGHRH